MCETFVREIPTYGPRIGISDFQALHQVWALSRSQSYTKQYGAKFLLNTRKKTAGYCCRIHDSGTTYVLDTQSTNILFKGFSGFSVSPDKRKATIRILTKVCEWHRSVAPFAVKSSKSDVICMNRPAQTPISVVTCCLKVTAKCVLL